MSRFATGGDEYRRGASTAQCLAFLRLIDAGGEDLRVFVIEGTLGTLKPGGANRLALSDCDVVAANFKYGSFGKVNTCAIQIGTEAKAAGKRFAVVGQPRRDLSPDVLALSDWVVY